MFSLNFDLEDLEGFGNKESETDIDDFLFVSDCTGDVDDLVTR